MSVLHQTLFEPYMNDNLDYNGYQTIGTILGVRSAEKNIQLTRNIASCFCHIMVIENLCYNDPESLEGWKYGHASSSCFLIGLFINYLIYFLYQYRAGIYVRQTSGKASIYDSENEKGAVHVRSLGCHR